jgi:nucleoside-diphosphate-sugar epimerase
MKILVTGATGFVGAHLVRLLAAQGHEVFALVRPTTPSDWLQELGVTRLYGDLEHGPPGGYPNFDAVIHVAGCIKASSKKEFYRVNTQGTQSLIRALGEIGRFVLVSSLAARGPNAGVDDLLGIGPVSHYGKSKLGAEDVALMSLPKDKLVIVRPPAVYGPGDRETLAIFKILKRGRFPVFGNAIPKMSFVHIDDLCRALSAAATSPFAGCGPFYPDDGHSGYGWEDLATIGQELYQQPIKKWHVPLAVLKVLALASEVVGKITGSTPMLTRDKYAELKASLWFCSSQTLRNAYPHGELTSLTEGFRTTDQWYHEKGWYR